MTDVNISTVVNYLTYLPQQKRQTDNKQYTAKAMCVILLKLSSIRYLLNPIVNIPSTARCLNLGSLS